MKRYSVVDWSSRYETGESRRLKRLDWIAVPVDFLGRDYLRLTKRDDSIAVFSAFILILEVAAMMPERGILERNGLPLTPHDLADLTRFPVDLFRDALPVLCAPPSEGGLGLIQFEEVETEEEKRSSDLFTRIASPESPENDGGSPRVSENTHDTLHNPDPTRTGQDKTKERGSPSEPPAPPSHSSRGKKKGVDYPEAFERAFAPFIEIGRNRDKFAAFLAWRKTVEGACSGSFAFPPVDPEELVRASRRYIDRKRKEEAELQFVFNASTFFGPRRHWEGYLLPDPEEEKERSETERREKKERAYRLTLDRTEELRIAWAERYGADALPPGYYEFYREALRETEKGLPISTDWIEKTTPLERDLGIQKAASS